MTAPRRRTTLLPGPIGDLEVLSTGQGVPSSIFVHGLASSIEGTRPYGTSVPGRRTFLHLRGHGRSGAPVSSDGWSYDALSRDVSVVADSVSATRAFGVSMGAGAICALLAVTPSRFQRVVLALPASIDAPIAREGEFEAMASAWEAADHARFAEVLISTLPREAQGVSAAWGADEAARLLALPGMGAALRAVPGETPLRDRAVLALVTADVLVIGQEGDPAHPAQVARELAGCFPNGRSVILPPGGLLHRHRSEVRDLVRDALV